MKIVQKKPFSVPVIADCQNKEHLDVAQEFIGKENWIQFIVLNNDEEFLLCLDENALTKDLDFNFYIKTSNPIMPIQKVCGTAIFIRIDTDISSDAEVDYKVKNLKKDDLYFIKQLLSASTQNELEEEYKQTPFSDFI